jgi:type IV pilus assembly protein PilA
MKMNKKGFTLIELLIVVAIIAILAAIAIPQFSKYRIRGYNAAADSDLRNMKIALEAFNTDNQVYGNTLGCVSGTPACVGGVPGNGAILAGPVSYVISFAAGVILAGPPAVPAAPSQMLFGLSNNVSAVVSTTAATGAAYVAQTASAPGDTIYASDSDSTSLFRAGKDAAGAAVVVTAGVPGTPMAAASIVGSTTGAVDIIAPYVAM